MNDVVRNYTWGNLKRRRRSVHHRSRGLAKFLLPVFAVMIVGYLWLTRDNYMPNEFIPADSGVEIYMLNPVDKRTDIFSSRVFSLAPEGSEAHGVVNQLAGELPLPEWLLNNICAGPFHVSAASADHLGDAVIMTRMTRVGTLTSRLASFAPQVHVEYTGGLRLRYIPDASLYYAVRGRTLLVSMSRNRLVYALTLHPTNALEASQYRQGVLAATQADLFCRLGPEAFPWTPPVFAQMETALRVGSDTVHLTTNGTLSPAFTEHYTPFLATLTPQPLPMPLDGFLTTSVAANMDLPALLTHLSESLPALAAAAEMLAEPQPEDMTAELIEDMQTLLQQALRSTGSRMRFAWSDLDPYEMMPAPLISATFDINTYDVIALFERVAPAPEVSSGVDLAPRLDEEHMLAYAPFVGGEAIEPAITLYANGMLVSSSANLAREQLRTAPLTETYPQDGNLFLRIQPHPMATAIVDVAREFAASGLLRAHTEPSLEAAAAPWLDAVEAIDSVVLFAYGDNGQLHADLTLTMHDASDTPNAATPLEAADEE